MAVAVAAAAAAASADTVAGGSGSSGSAARRVLQGAPVRPGEAEASAACGAGRGAGRAEEAAGRAGPARCTGSCSRSSFGERRRVGVSQ